MKHIVIGRFRWETIAVQFRDPIGPSATQALNGMGKVTF